MARSFTRASSEYLEIDSTPVTAVPLTMACWFNSDDLTTDQNAMFIGNSAAPTDYFALELSGTVVGDPIRAIARRGATEQRATSSSGYSSGTWHHGAAVYTAADDWHVLLDGGSKGTQSVSTVPSGSDRISIGRKGDSSPADYMSGDIAEAAIWNVALADAEVIILALGYSPLFVRPQSLVAYWSLIRDEDQDRVGGYDLTAYNTPGIATHLPSVKYPPLSINAFAAAAAAGHAGKLVSSIPLKSKVFGGLV